MPVGRVEPAARPRTAAHATGIEADDVVRAVQLPAQRRPLLRQPLYPGRAGPPGITMSVPRRAAGRSLRSRDTASVSCGPSGRR